MRSADAGAVVRIARTWIGTPYVDGAALKGAGCDCIGLIRGVYGDLNDIDPPEVPPWRADWYRDRARPLLRAAITHLADGPTGLPGPGDVVGFRFGPGREAHVGIASFEGRVIHAVEARGVVEVPLAPFSPAIFFVRRFPILKDLNDAKVPD